MQVISCKEAKARGLKRYFTGKPCKYGHVSGRRVRDGACIKCRLAANRRWRIRNPKKQLESDRRYRLANPEKMRARERRWRLANPEKVALKSRKAAQKRTLAAAIVRELGMKL